MTGPKRPKKSSAQKPASRRGGAKSARELAKIGPSRPAGPNKDPRTAEGRAGAKANDARLTARSGLSGLDDSAKEGEARERATDRVYGKPYGKTDSGSAAAGPRRFSQGGFKKVSAYDQGKPTPSGPKGAAFGVDLKTPPPETVFRDLEKGEHRFADSSLKRVAAQLLNEKRKPWRYRPFPFPLFTDKGNEQTFYFDFYVYDNMDMILKLILVAPRESAEIWDKIGRFKRQYPMYSYELWTPEKLLQLQKPRAQLGF